MRFRTKTPFNIIFFLVFAFYGHLALATTYSDAESGATGWTVFDNTPAGASVFSVFDSALQSNVIQTQGSGRDNRYLLGGTNSDNGWNNTDEFTLTWKMATSEYYGVQLYVLTTSGTRRLNYTKSNSDSLKNPGNNSISFGLGSGTLDGQWQSFERDLAADVAVGEPGNQLLGVNGMMILGSVRLDDIALGGGGVVEPPAEDAPPVAVISTDVRSGNAPLVVSFNASGSTAADGASINSYNWNFGNGDSSTSQSATTSFTQTGSYTATLTVTDSNDLSDSASVNISVNGGSSNSCDGFITSAEEFVVPYLDKPRYLNRYKDPTFDGSVVRVTNSAFSEVRKPSYSTMQAWNADESLLLLYKSANNTSGSGHILLDGHSYAPFRELAIVPSDIEEVFWSHTNPDEFFYVSKASADFGMFKRYNVSSDSSTDITNFRQYCETGLPQGGGDVHMQSLDDDLFGFRCRLPDGSYRMLSYRISTGQVVTAPIGDGTPWSAYFAPMPAPSGDRFWYQGAALAPNLTSIQRQMDLKVSYEHSSVGLTHAGQDALYQVAFDASPSGCNGDAFNGVGHLIEHNLETGECRSIISEEQGYPYTTSSTHISAQAYLQPGLIAMSSIGNRDQLGLFTSNTPAPALFSEIYLADTNPANPTTCRLAHHRSYGKSAKNGGYKAYFGEPHATISPSGTRIIFASDWYDSGSVDSYVLELPGYQRP